jgi:hypothetical protein
MRSHLNLEGLCIWHDPERKGRAHRMRVKAGKIGARRKWASATPPPPPQTLDDAVRYSSFVAHAVAIGDLDAKRGQVVTKAIEAFQRGLKERDLAKQVRELEAQVKTLKKGERAR